MAQHLIHIIPDVHRARALSPTPSTVLPSVEFVQLLVPFPTVRVEEIDPCAVSTPTQSLQLPAMLVLDEYIKLLSFLVNRVIEGTFDMRIDNNNHLCKVNFHKIRMEMSSIPFERGPRLR